VAPRGQFSGSGDNVRREDVESSRARICRTPRALHPGARAASGMHYLRPGQMLRTNSGKL
jgi:hypothetical protein